MSEIDPKEAENDAEQPEEVEDDVLAEYLGNEAADVEPEDGEDLFGSDAEKDYEVDSELDHYEEESVDEDIQPMDIASRRAVDAQISKRQKKERKQLGDKIGVERAAYAVLSSDEDNDMEGSEKGDQSMDMLDASDQALWGDLTNDKDMMEEEEGDSDSEGEEIDFSKRKVSLREWLVLDRVRKQIIKQLKNFLNTFEDEKQNLIYPSRIEAACLNNRQSLEINYDHLQKAHPYLAVCLAEAPTEMLEIFDQVCMEATLVQFPYYANVTKEMKARITHLPPISLRDLRQIHLNALIKVCGVVTRQTAVFPQLDLVKYNCAKCNSLLGPFKQTAQREMKPTGSCPQCESKGPFTMNVQETVYRNYQRITLQESPGSVPAGRLPRSKDVILLGDIIDLVRPGEEVEVTGIFRHNYDLRLNRNQGFPVFATIVEGNYINKKEDMLSNFHLDDKDIREIRRLAQDKRIGEKIIRSIAPSIYGHHDIKTAIALALFGGNAKELVGKNTGKGEQQMHHRIRGDINVLLMGDPGTAKSQFLKYVEKTAGRAVYTTGQGATAVGLTASVHKDQVTKEWTLEGGALVLADKGVCLIDEFDKMNDKDRTSIHEAMEQQSISISKAGIVTSLQARCAIIAAANPVRGRYDQSLSFAQNVDLTEPILSRFDILCTVRDLVDPVQDEQLASFVVDSHIRSHPCPDEDTLNLILNNLDASNKKLATETIPQDLLRKYIIYAKKHCTPKLTNINRDRIAKVYAELRNISKRDGGLPMGVRHLESILRICESSARMHLRSYVVEEDVNLGISVLLKSFIDAQKLSVAKAMRVKFRKYVTHQKDSDQLLLHLMQQIVKDELQHQRARLGIKAGNRIEVPLSHFETRARELDITSLHSFFESKEFRSNGFIFDNLRKVVIKDCE